VRHCTGVSGGGQTQAWSVWEGTAILEQLDTRAGVEAGTRAGQARMVLKLQLLLLEGAMGGRQAC